MSYCAIWDICASYNSLVLINASHHTNSQNDYIESYFWVLAYLSGSWQEKFRGSDPGTLFCPPAPWAPVNTSKTRATLVNRVNTSTSWRWDTGCHFEQKENSIKHNPAPNVVIGGSVDRNSWSSSILGNSVIPTDLPIWAVEHQEFVSFSPT